MMHNFKKFPELTDAQMDLYYFQSPHKQITESFSAKCEKVIDGDTIKVIWKERDFPFKIRFANIAAPEMNEQGGAASKEWLRREIEGKNIEVIINKNNRVDKWGRLIGYIIHKGIDLGEQSVNMGYSLPWKQRADGAIKNFEEMIS